MAFKPTKTIPPTTVYPDKRFFPDPQPESNADAPSQLKNNLDQISQPTGHGVAGGDLPPVGAPGNEDVPDLRGMVSVTLGRNYVPLSDSYTVVTVPAGATGVGRKMLAGTQVWLPAAEADTLVNDGRATLDPVRV